MGPEPPPTDDKPPDDEAPEEPEEPEEPEPEPEPSPPSKPPDDENRQIGDDESAHRAQERLRRTLGLLLWEQQDYEELLVIDHEGVVLVSTFDAHEGRSAAGIDYFSNGLRTTYVQPVFMSPITDRLTMMVSTPIRDESQRVVGVVAARLNLSRFFQLLADDTGLGKSGETVVGHKVDSDILFMAPTRHDADAASNRRIPIGGKFSRPLQEAARGQVGSGEAIDYRGQEVLAAWQHIPALNWGLVVKMDRAEAWQAIVEMQRNFAMMMLAVLVAVGLCSMLVARALVAPLRELKEATDRISKGDLDVKLRIASRDEIGELADSFERMVAAIKFFREEAEHERDEVPEGEDDSDSDSDPAGPKTPP
jgi:HAMP domain-containing protein